MAGAYDAILDAEQGAAPAASQNPYDAFLDAEVQQNQQRVRTVFEKALTVNPDQAAESKKLANTTGLAPDLVARNLDEVKRKEQARMLDLARMSQDSPVLARQLMDPGFTNQAHDHLDNLSALEQTFNVVRSVPAGAMRGVGSLLSGSGEIVDIGARATGLTAVSRAVKDLTGADLGIALDVAGSLKFAGSGWKMLADSIGVAPEDKNFATDVGEGIGQLVQQIGVQIATGGTASLVSLFSQGADAMASKTSKDNSSQALKDTAVLAGASITALTEKYGVDALLNRVPPAIKNSALRWVADKLVAGGIEATQEVTEGVLQDVVRKLITNSEAKIGEGVAYEAGVAGTSAAIVRAALGVRARGAADQQRGVEAEQGAEQLKAQFQLASQALLRERNPDEFRTLVQSMVDNTDGAPKEIYIDAEVLNQLAPEMLAQLPQSVQDQLPDALAANDVVSIPVGDVLTVAPGTPLEAMLIENARIGDVTAMSQAEAKQAGAKAQEFLAQESQRVIAQAIDQQAMQESSDRVKQGVLDQLNTVGRFRKDVNEGYATWTAAFYTTMAGRLGVTPEQMAQQYPLRIAGQSGQGNTLKTGRVGEVAVEGFHFSKADRSFVSTAMYGTGLQGSNRETFKNAKDKRLAKRAYFYADTGTGINPEAGVGGRGHKAKLANVYDSNTDPLRLKGGSQEDFESKVLDAGFSGYLDRLSGTQSGQVIMLGEQDIAVEQLGNLAKTTGERVAPAGTRESKGRDVVVDALNANTALPAGSPTVARWQTLLAKDPEVLQALTDAGVFAGDQNRNLYKSELVKAFQNATASESYAQQEQALRQEIEQAGGTVNDILQVDQLISSEEIPTLTLQDLIGLDIFPTIADRTAAAAVYSGIDSSRLDVAIPLLGGPLFPLRETNVEAGVVWANRGKGVTSQKAAKLKAGANYMMVLLGDADMHQSNSTVAAAVMGTMEAWQRDGRISAEQSDALTELVRSSPSSDPRVKGYLENFPGFDDASIMHAYMDGMSFDARKRVIERLASKDAMKLGAPPMNQILDATREPSMAGHRWGDGVILLEVDQVNTQVELGTEGTTAHPDFPVGIRGRVVGKLNAPLNWQVLWQDWIKANPSADVLRAFSLAKPVVTVTQELVTRIGPINQGNIDSARQARLAADFAADNWRRTGVPVKEGGASPQEFVDAILTTAARPVLTEYSLKQVKDGAKDGSFKVFQLGTDGRIFFGMKYGDPGYAGDYGIDIPEIGTNEVALVSVVNNEQGARGIGAPAVVLKALQEGATVLDCFAVKNEKFTDGFLPEIYAAFGFEKVAEIPFAPEYYSEQKLADAVKFWKDTTPGFDPATNGYPPLVIMKWKGSDADRTDIINRYLRDGVAGVLARGASTAVEASEAGFAPPDGAETAAQGGTADTQRAAGNQGNSAGARVASRAQRTIQGIAGLNDGELRNLGLTTADRDAVQRALGIPATDNAVLNQGVAAQPAAPQPLAQGPRGTFNPKNLELALNENADLSTFLHETGHFFLEVMADLASQPNAPADIAADMDKLVKWFGVADLATWNGYTLDQKRPYHERFAESFEQYLMEGKAPSLELQPLFRKFRAWMLNVYKSLKAFVDGRTGETQIQLSPEIRQVFDRMVASEEQIAQANEVAGLLPNEDADAEAMEKLTARSLRDLKWTVNARAKEIKKLQDQAKELRKGVEAEVTTEVNAMPEFQAKAALDKLRESTPEYKDALKDWTGRREAALERASETLKAELLAANPEVKGLQKGQLLAKNKRLMANQAEAQALAWEKDNVKPVKPIPADNDMELATVADSFGYPDVQSMLQAIDAAGKKADVIEGMTDQRMLERHGDLIDQRAIEQAANEAVHNQARAKSLATELKAQAEMLNPRTDTGNVSKSGSKITVNAIVEAAKQFAADVVSRTPLKDLKAKAWQHTAAERRAGKRWQEATAAGQTQEAVKAKQDQVLNNAAAKAAMDARAEMRKILTFFKRVIKDNNEKVVDKGRDPDVVNAARAVLGAYGIAPKGAKNAMEYMDLVAKNDPAMHAALQPSVQGALNMAQPLDALTMEELRGLHEEIQAMWHLAKRSRQMEVDGNLLDMEDAEAELQDRMQAIGVPVVMPGDFGAVTKAEERVRKLQGVRALLRRVEQWAEGMGKPFTRLVFQPVKEAADRYRADRVVYRKKYQALVDTVAPALLKGKIAAPELGYSFGEGHNGIGHAELLHAVLHTGNASNKRKLLLGRGWATENADGTMDTSKWDAFLTRMHDTGVLNKAHYDFAQGVWDLLEQTKPLAQKTHRDVFGRYFAEVTADSFTTPFGDYAGGYVPAQADPRIVQDADLRKLSEIENENMSFSFPGTNKGFTKGRVEYNRPLMLDLRSIGQHLDKVLLFSHMEPAVRDVNKLLSRKGVSYSLGRIDPAAYSGMLTPWLNRSARQIVETPIVGDAGISRVLSAARSRAGMGLMFANVSNTLQQITGFSLAAVKVKPSSMMAATAQFIAGPKAMAQTVSQASSFMANRMENEVAAMNDAMDDILLDPSTYDKAQNWSRKHAYFMQTAMANTMEPIIWTAAYNDALARGESERDAVRFGDSVVRTTQGSTLPEDVSRIETGPAYARIFTQFIGYFNMMANTNATALKQISQEVGLKKGAGKALGVVTLGFLIPIWVAEAIAHAMRGGPEDEDDDGYLDDWLAAVFGMGTIKGSLAMVPFVGQLANAAINRFNGNPADDRVSLSPAVSLLEAAAGVPVDVYKAITDPEKLNMRNAVRDVASLVTIATGLPAVALARPLGYLAGVADDRIDPTGPVDMARGIVSGTPSPDSK